ncbi:MAG TPA: VOC family protein [Burkholderiales bacterium]|nr:VOC family protein [Burkholderiales bacterium]
MKLHALTPMLSTWDLDASIAFYTETLGFDCEKRVVGWASLKRDGVGIMFSSPNEHMGYTGPALTGSLYFKTTDVDGLWQRLKDKTRVCYPIESFDYGMREFAIFDNNGYLLQFGQPQTA